MNADVRTMKTPAEQALSAAYTSARSRLPGKGAVASLREDAFKRFEERGLPHRRVEEWKYTDLRALMRDMAPLAGAPDAAARAKAKEAGKILAGVEMRRIVFVDGAFAPELSDLTPEPGLTIGSLADALAKGGVPALGTAFSTDDVAVALNTALMGDGAVIDVAAHARIRRPIHLVFAGTGNSSAFVRSLVTIGEGAEVTLIEDHDSGEAQVNAALELIVGDHARVEYFKLTQAKGLHVASLLARIGADAHFNSFAYTAGSPLVRNQSFIRFDGERTHAGIRGVNLLRGKDHVDTTLLIMHAKGHCESREQFKTVLDNEAHGVFQGKIVVAQHAQRTDAKMLTRALLLSEDA